LDDDDDDDKGDDDDERDATDLRPLGKEERRIPDKKCS